MVEDNEHPVNRLRKAGIKHVPLLSPEGMRMMVADAKDRDKAIANLATLLAERKGISLAAARRQVERAVRDEPKEDKR